MSAEPVVNHMLLWVVGGGMAAVLLIVALLAAMLFSGRFWAVVAGVVGTLLLVVGGLLVVSAWIFVRKGAPPVETAAIVEQQRLETMRPSVAEAPNLSGDNVFGASESVESPAEKADAGPPPGAPRPAWMDGQMGRIGDVYRTTVKVGPLFSRTECEKQLPAALHDAVRTYADHHLGEERGQFVHLPTSYIRHKLVRDEWEERRQTTYDTMIILHELLEFDREANEAIEANYRQSVVTGRLAYTAAGGGIVLGLLTILFGYLKLDTLTRRSYTGRLRLTATGAILALAAVVGLLVIG